MGVISDAEAREYVAALLRHFVHKLTEWEDGFLRDNQKRSTFSEKQREIIDRIMDRCAAQHGRFADHDRD